jgi:hypothetical protein
LDAPRQPDQMAQLSLGDTPRGAAVGEAPSSVISALHNQTVAATVAKNETVRRRQTAVLDPRSIRGGADVSPDNQHGRSLAYSDHTTEK